MSKNGFKDLEKSLKNLEKNIKESTGQVPIDKVCNSKFMTKYTNFTSFDELLKSGNYNVNSSRDFEAIPKDEFDIYISKNTKFSTWNKMLSTATEEYLKSTLKF
ncbi:hypothetical protein CDFC105_73435 [Clostridioides difficile]|uniref:hypothetical protein n=1 Tax=Clostridioides sp. ZZV14-6150 TaxID=2811493 RepID=UPI0007BB4153|nr:hypothetical protein [Clostridioides sp. ZZV14-6150]CZR97687.1 hypothetical protein CDFC105_62480 [Clostridioides difficile]CZS10280.1 hypothetical protein CDFC105_73435 [Clostridioides difficile]